MLRPKKNITRKEIQRDPFLESVDQAQAHLEKNRNTYLQIGIALIVLLIGYNIISGKRAQHRIDGSTSLSQALIALERNDLNTAEFQLETVNNDFSKTSSGELSLYYLGKMKYESGEFENAQKYLNKFLKKNSLDYLNAPAYIILADIELNNNKINNAISLIDKGIRKCKDLHNTRTLKLQKAKLSYQKGDKEIARDMINKFLNEEENLGSDHRQIAEEMFGKLVG